MDSERVMKIKDLVHENAKKSLVDKSKKAEEKKEKEERNKVKLILADQKNQEIRHINASRFSRNKIYSNNELTRRLPWGINQEKLRNYAIQVLIQFRNQDIKSSQDPYEKRWFQPFQHPPPTPFNHTHFSNTQVHNYKNQKNSFDVNKSD